MKPKLHPGNWRTVTSGAERVGRTMRASTAAEAAATRAAMKAQAAVVAQLRHDRKRARTA